MPGTEVAFESDAESEPAFPLFRNRKLGQRVARFRQVDLDRPTVHHDALEFPDGNIVLVTDLVEGQRVTVLQLPATGETTPSEHEHEREHISEPTTPLTV